MPTQSTLIDKQQTWKHLDELTSEILCLSPDQILNESGETEFKWRGDLLWLLVPRGIPVIHDKFYKRRMAFVFMVPDTRDDGDQT